MDECVIAGAPTPAFVAKFERAVELLKQYSLQELSLPPYDLAHKAIKEVGFIEQDPDQDMLERLVLAYYRADNAPDKAVIIVTAWNLYNNT